jgi:hypothetical protein
MSSSPNELYVFIPYVFVERLTIVPNALAAIARSLVHTQIVFLLLFVPAAVEVFSILSLFCLFFFRRSSLLGTELNFRIEVFLFEKFVFS